MIVDGRLIALSSRRSLCFKDKRSLGLIIIFGGCSAGSVFICFEAAAAAVKGLVGDFKSVSIVNIYLESIYSL